MWLALLVACLGLVNLRFDLLREDRPAWIAGQIKRIKIGVPLCFFWIYITLPALVPWVGYTLILLPLGVNALVTMIARSARAKKGRRLSALGGLSAMVLLFSLVVPFLLNILVVPAFAKSLRDVPIVQESLEPMSVMDTAHVRLVPIETALWKAQKVVGNLGTGFQVGKLSIQMVDGKLYWVAPLEFRGFFKWLSFRESPGFVLVDGEDPDAAAIYQETKFSYTPSSFFGHDLNRHVYGRYSDVLLLEPSFELDDQFKPWYVMSIGVPTVGKTGVKVTGAVIVDPSTGAMTRFDLQQVPTWADQVIPEFVAEQQNYWFGRYTHGFWNSILGQKDVHTPTTWEGAVDVFGVIGADSRFYWFTGHTSPSAKDDSLMGYTMMDGRTGIITYYRNAVGFYNESAAVSSVNAAVSNFSGWHGAQPLLYNLYGTESYIVPVLSDNNKLQAIGVVNAKTGQTVVKPTKLEALMSYKLYLGSGIVDAIPTQAGDYQTLQGKVIRIGPATISGNTVFYISIEGSNLIFTTDATLSSEIPLTKVGDSVEITYLDTAESVANLASFDNLNLGVSPTK